MGGGGAWRYPARGTHSSALVQNLDEMVESLEKIDEIDREEIRLCVERNFSVRVMVENNIQVYKIAMRNTS